MKLQTYLENKKESPNAFAIRIGVPAHTIYRYIAGRVPRPDVMASVYKATAGAVQPNDFYDLPAIRKKAS
jgi:predicted transcriptional regulator